MIAIDSAERNETRDQGSADKDRVRVLYSFPMKLGGVRACTTAWYQVTSLAKAGAEVTVFPGVVQTALPAGINAFPTLARGKFRIPYRVLGRLRSYALHDYIVAHRLEKLAGKFDIVHVWPLAAARTEKVAKKLGIPTVYERPNAHTGFFYRTVHEECVRLGIELPENHEHRFNAEVVAIEEEEYRLADWILCPSDFVVQSFVSEGFSAGKLLRHQYGFDENVYHADQSKKRAPGGLRMLFAGTCSPVKGLHYALEAWLRSPACENGTFSILGRATDVYMERLAPMLAHPSVRVLGFRSDVAELMRQNDVFILPSIAEGSALVTYEARASGCVLLVSDASGAICTHNRDAFVHHVGDVTALESQITILHENPALLEKLRTASLATVSEISWTAAGRKLLSAYRQALQSKTVAV